MAHRWHIVLNNPTPLEETIIDREYSMKNNWWVEQKIRFMFYRKHTNQKRKTPHYHIYIEFSVKKKFNYVREIIGFSRAHIEKCYDTREKNILYIKNEDKEVINLEGEKFNIIDFLDF